VQHFYPLYQDVDVECRCCGRAERFHFKSASDQVICDSCVRHQGDQPSRQKMREVEHKRLWQAILDDWHADYSQQIQTLLENHTAEVAGLRTELTSLRETVSDFRGALSSELNSRPVESLAAWFEQTNIAEAEARTERAHGFIGHLFRVLWAIDQLHAPGPDEDTCICPDARTCGVLAAMAPVRGRLYQWESKQVTRLREGRPHSLPDEHPQVRRGQPWAARNTYRWPA
jgi:hypothetical protein